MDVFVARSKKGGAIRKLPTNNVMAVREGENDLHKKKIKGEPGVIALTKQKYNSKAQDARLARTLSGLAKDKIQGGIGQRHSPSYSGSR